MAEDKPRRPQVREKQSMPRQDPQERIHNFYEVALGYGQDQARAEAERCLRCKKSPCVAGCPVEIDIPAFVDLVRKGDFEGAIRKIREKIEDDPGRPLRIRTVWGVGYTYER